MGQRWLLPNPTWLLCPV